MVLGLLLALPVVCQSDPVRRVLVGALDDEDQEEERRVMARVEHSLLSYRKSNHVDGARTGRGRSGLEPEAPLGWPCLQDGLAAMAASHAGGVVSGGDFTATSCL